MRRKKLFALLLAAATATLSAGVAPAQTFAERQIYALPKEELTDAEVRDILFMREEEKLARDVYLTLYDYWKLPIFRNIARSEQWHMQLVGYLIDKYSLPDPVARTGDRVGEFQNPELKKLYAELTEQGKRSLVDALKVGALIEELDIHDLERALSETDNEDVRLVYYNLEKGSRNHLRAFVRQLSRLGESYEPRYISKEEFERIISTPIERGFRVKEASPSAVRNSASVEGTVVSIKKEPLTGRMLWWVVQIESGKDTYSVYLVPAARVRELKIEPGSEVKVEGFVPPLLKNRPNALIACRVETANGTSITLRKNCP